MYLLTNKFFFKKDIFFVLAISLFVCIKAGAQNTSSPYSIIGIGDIENSYFNRTSGMANTGIGYRNSHSLVGNNPAGFSALENQFFTGEIGIRGKLVNYSSNPINADNNTSTDITIKRF